MKKMIRNILQNMAVFFTHCNEQRMDWISVIG